jgi:hypothetical protein
MRMLLTLYRETGDRKYLEPIPKALEYLKRSFVPRTNDEIFRRIPEGPVVARFYELKTNRPLYITKGSRLSAAGLGSRMVDGYEISYTPESVITHYGVLTSGASWQQSNRITAASLLRSRHPTQARQVARIIALERAPAPGPEPSRSRRKCGRSSRRSTSAARGPKWGLSEVEPPCFHLCGEGHGPPDRTGAL